MSGMPDWTKTNFGDLRDLSPEDARVQWRFAREALGSPELGVSRFTYDPGGRMPWGHRHRVHRAWPGRIRRPRRRSPPAVVRSFEAGPEGLDVICIGGRKPQGGDSERFQDFWD